MKDHIDKIIEDSLKKTEKLENDWKLIETKFNLDKVQLGGGDEKCVKSKDLYFNGEVIPKINSNKNMPLDKNWIDIGPRRDPIIHTKKKNGDEPKKHGRGNDKKKKGWKEQVGGGFDH